MWEVKEYTLLVKSRGGSARCSGLKFHTHTGDRWGEVGGQHQCNISSFAKTPPTSVVNYPWKALRVVDNKNFTIYNLSIKQGLYWVLISLTTVFLLTRKGAKCTLITGGVEWLLLRDHTSKRRWKCHGRRRWWCRDEIGTSSDLGPTNGQRLRTLGLSESVLLIRVHLTCTLDRLKLKKKEKKNRLFR